MEKIHIEYYVTEDGKRPFIDWLEGLKDFKARTRIEIRLDRVRLGNFGDHESVSEGVNELRIHYGPGYRVYYGREGKTLVLLLAGGSKKTQGRDIKRAKGYWEDYKGLKGYK